MLQCLYHRRAYPDSGAGATRILTPNYGTVFHCPDHHESPDLAYDPLLVAAYCPYCGSVRLSEHDVGARCEECGHVAHLPLPWLTCDDCAIPLRGIYPENFYPHDFPYPHIQRARFGMVGIYCPTCALKYTLWPEVARPEEPVPPTDAERAEALANIQRNLKR